MLCPGQSWCKWQILCTRTRVDTHVRVQAQRVGCVLGWLTLPSDLFLHIPCFLYQSHGPFPNSRKDRFKGKARSQARGWFHAVLLRRRCFPPVWSLQANWNCLPEVAEIERTCPKLGVTLLKKMTGSAPVCSLFFKVCWAPAPLGHLSHSCFSPRSRAAQTS